jgi:iron complex outermembrane receptor protein
LPLLSSCAAVCLLAAAGADAASAATGSVDGAVDEIVILGRRADPADVTLGAGPVTQRMSPSSRAVERELIQAVGATRLSDVLELVSGVSQQNNRGGVMDNFAIRGFLGTPDGGAEYYVDGFLANRGLAPPRDPAVAERVELLKGPAGALFGDIDPAGRVNIVSKTPRSARHAEATATLGSFGLRRGELDIGGPLTQTLAGRLVVAREHSDGWRDHVSRDRATIAPSLTWRPNDRTRLTYVGEWTRFDTPFDRGQPAVNGDATALPASRYFGEPGDGVTRFRNLRHQLTGETGLGGDWKLTGGLAWREGSLKGFSSDQSRLVGDTLWRQRRQRDYSATDISARMELSGRIDSALGVHRPSLSLKAYSLDYREGLMRRNPSATSTYGINIYNPVYGGQALALLPFTDNRETRSVATLYVEDLWEVTDRLSLTGGLRYDDYVQKIRNRRTGVAGKATGQPLDYRLAARYRLNEAWALHGSYGQSFVLNSGLGRTGAGFAPERGKGGELGVSGRWKGVDLGITAFDITKQNILANDPIDPNFLAPVGRLKSKGIEADLSAELTDAWRVIVNYAYTHARADDKAFATDAVLNVPEHSGGAYLIGRFPTGRGTDWSVTAGAAYVGDRAGAIDASGLRLPAYWKAKAAVDYGLTPSLTLRAEVDNLFDERYAASSYSPVWIYPGAPRAFRMSLRMAM